MKKIQKKKTRRDEKQRFLSTKCFLLVKFITDPWQGALVIKINVKVNILTTASSTSLFIWF